MVAESRHAIGVVHLKDIVKGGLKDRFERFRAMGIKTVMITGDNRLTAAAIAREAGVDDFLAEARPEDKLALIRKEQAAGHLVAMTGDGTNDAPALPASRCCSPHIFSGCCLVRRVPVGGMGHIARPVPLRSGRFTDSAW